MQNDNQGKRKMLLSQFRTSLQAFPIVNSKTIDLKSKYEKNLLLGIWNCAEQGQRSLSLKSEQGEVQSFSSFLQKYEIVQKLGEGGNGCVYKCQHKKNQKFYAAKKFRVEEQHILQLKKLFIYYKEFNCSSVIEYKALYFDKGQRSAYLVMEYFKHPSLEQVVIKDEEELKNIVKEVLLAIKYIHSKNICHRDIKPENLLYDQENKKIKLIDFGISKKTFLRGARRDMLTIIGTHFYLAPEVYLGGGYDQRVDLWALGVTVYQLIAGKTPFESEYHSDTIANIIKNQVSYQDQAWQKYSLAKSFVSQLLKNKDQRMTLSQALNHLWLNQPKYMKMSRFISFQQQLSRQFHDEINLNLKNAISKEQGQLQTQECSFHFQTSNIDIKVRQYDLSDEESETSIISMARSCKSTPFNKNQKKFSRSQYALSVQLPNQNQQI